MSVDDAIGLAIAIGLVAYLLWTLIFPERLG